MKPVKGVKRPERARNVNSVTPVSRAALGESDFRSDSVPEMRNLNLRVVTDDIRYAILAITCHRANFLANFVTHPEGARILANDHPLFAEGESAHQQCGRAEPYPACKGRMPMIKRACGKSFYMLEPLP